MSAKKTKLRTQKIGRMRRKLQNVFMIRAEGLWTFVLSELLNPENQYTLKVSDAAEAERLFGFTQTGTVVHIWSAPGGGYIIHPVGEFSRVEDANA